MKWAFYSGASNLHRQFKELVLGSAKNPWNFTFKKYHNLFFFLGNMNCSAAEFLLKQITINRSLKCHSCSIIKFGFYAILLVYVLLRRICSKVKTLNFCKSICSVLAVLCKEISRYFLRSWKLGMKNQIFHILACNLNPVQTEVSLFHKYLFNTGSLLRLTDLVVF